MSGSTPERVLIRAPNWLGDVVLSLPAVRDVRRAFPRSSVSVLARPSVAPLFEAVGEVDAVLTANGARAEIAAQRSRFDLTILLTNSIGTAIAAAAAGIPERWGYSTQGRGLLLTRAAPVPAGVRGRSQVHYYRSMLAAMGLPTSDALDTSIAPPTAWKEAGRALIGPNRSFGVAPGAAKGTAKQWPPERFAAAADRIAMELGAEAVLLGSAADANAARAVALTMKSRAKNLCGQTDLRSFVGLVASLDGLIANDSGAMHIGAALGVPTVGIFGPTNSDETHPVGKRAAYLRGLAECSPCKYVTCPIDHRCMTSVAPASVVDILLREMRS